MQEAYKEMLSKIDEIEKQTSLEDFVINSTISNKGHKMRMGESFLSSWFGIVTREQFSFFDNENFKKELNEFELAELYDNKNLCGEFNGEFD